MITLTPVRSRSDLRAFVTMVWRIYQDDPNWVPPVIADRQKLLDPNRNPFFRHAEMELWIAHKEGKLVGRIAAIVNHNHNKEHNDRVGFFGFFESIDDQEVADALLSRAESWLLDRGMDAMRGPVNPSMNDEAGLLVEGFDDPPVVLMTYNPKYYSRLIEGHGLRKAQDLYAYRLSRAGFISPKLARVQAAVRSREGLTVRSMKFRPKRVFQRDLAAVKRIYNSAWEPNWGFVRLTDDEFESIAHDLQQVALEELLVLVEKQGEVIGFGLGLPDINQRLIHNRRGGMLGAAWQLLLRRRPIKRGRILILGVLPAFQKRGIDAVLYYEVGTKMTEGQGYTEGEASWVAETNVMMIRAAELMNADLYKRYRVYEKSMNKN